MIMYTSKYLCVDVRAEHARTVKARRRILTSTTRQRGRVPGQYATCAVSCASCQSAKEVPTANCQTGNFLPSEWGLCGSIHVSLAFKLP